MTRERIVLVILLSLLTCGVFILLLSWKFQLRKYFLYKTTSDLDKCTHFLVLNEDGTSSICKKVIVSIRNILKNAEEQFIGFSHRKLIYTLPEISITDNTRQFQALEFPLTQIPFSQLAQQTSLLTQEAVFERRRDYGDCQKEVKIPSLPAFLLREMTSPFYILQYLSVFIWLLQEYIQFACIIISFQFCITLLNYFMTRSFLLKIKQLALHSSEVTVFRSGNTIAQDGEGKKIPTTELVVGDIIELNSKMDIPCDCILISGEILMNEVSLTGESIPIPKNSISESDDSCFDYSLSDHKKYYLYDGTTIFQLKHSAQTKVLARVVRVGFTSFKGQILRSILYPSPIEFDLMKNSVKFFCGLAIVMTIVFLSRIERMIDLDCPYTLYLYRIFDTITWIIPPFLPIFESLSLTFSLLRLRFHNIMGVEPQKTLLAGKVTHMCFDKTGTLTTNGITVLGFYDSKIQKMQTEKNAQKDCLQMKLFASCHGVYKLEGETVGDLLDVEMLRYSQYNISSSTEPNIKFNSTRGKSSLKILNLFEFDSNLQRMSCFAQDDQQQSKAYVFLKGAPEVVKSLCLPDSIPKNFTEQLNRLSLKGFRILGLSYKEIDLTQQDVNSIQRTDIEGDLNFLGLLVLENNLKDDTAQCIQRLQEGGIECKIISGDNPLTTLQTAGECGILNSERIIYLIDYSLQSQSISVQMIENEIIKNVSYPDNQVFQFLSTLVTKSEQIVITGNVLEYFENILRKPLAVEENGKTQENNTEKVTNSEDEENTNFKAKSENLALQLYKQLFGMAKVFSRMRSEQKRRIIEILQKQGIKVGMIGDGANDCEAIKQGDIGISFSSADAALSAPFSSSEDSINCVEVILRNGRATMSINIDIFRCLILQGIIKFVGCMVMVQEAQNYGDFQFTYLFFFCGMPFLAFMALSKPANKLEPRLPNEIFHSIPHLISIYSQGLIYSISMIIALVILTLDNKHIPTTKLIEQNGQKIFQKEGELNTIIFVMTIIFILTSGSAFFISVPFKLPFFKNYLLFGFTLISGVYCVFMMIFKEIQIPLFELKMAIIGEDHHIMLWVMLISGIAIIIVFIFEEMVVKRIVVPWFNGRQKSLQVQEEKSAS